MEPMIIRRVLQVLSWIALAMTIGPSLMMLCGCGGIDQKTMQNMMLGATIGWFIVTPLWGDSLQNGLCRRVD